ncbi:transporter [Ganoderma sinense ZZ0214-1]|uniref:non-specific serine/threonine protein kinase n=1 Tax=Ganoderma sinense ZZ0214-1 TaxID=1077348 RepID=A0A2G8SV11_9APHY|nr:transporter [Ganoderma sinense ZZ0214-1]
MVQISAILPDFSGLNISRGAFHLRMLNKISAGAYGVVYRAQDLAPDPHGARHYAVKCLLRHPDGSDLARQQQREIAHHRAVSDVYGVVTLHAVIEEEFYTFLVLDLISGGDLFTAIMEHGFYDHNDAAVRRTFLQLVDALAACHEAGVYHRDLKPENVLCSPGVQHAYLADFGLSTRSTRSSNFGCGSSFYMSPECLGIYREKTPYATGPSDVWALGTILCNMVSGRNPWYVASPKTDEGFRLFLREGAPWLQRNLPISTGAATLLGRIFELDPARRITLPELRVAVRSLNTFFPDSPRVRVPSSSSSSFVSSSVSVEVAVKAASAQPLTERSQNVARPDSAGQLRPLDLALPAALSTQFLSFSTEALATAAAAATLVHAETSTASHFSDSGVLDSDIWSVTRPRPVPATPDALSAGGDGGSSSGEESAGPDTPEMFAADAGVASPHVPEFALDSDLLLPSPEGVDVRAAVVAVKTEKKKRRGSLKAMMNGMRHMRIWTHA